MEIYFENERQVSRELLDLMVKSAGLCLSGDGISTEEIELSVSFVDKNEIRELNKNYRGMDKVTDVLSFPQFDSLYDLPKEGYICLGDVVICKDRAEEQAEELGHSYEREIIYLFTHSVLHLLGYDHMNEEEKKIMRKREEEVMETLQLPRTERL
ncbi:MAG: rRNA maturation RNase YbeY [Eubacterium sp.]|nr:rRNA maturation RNase YbeY [Eubacterium sp.]